MRRSLFLSAAALLVSTAACSTDSPLAPSDPLDAKNGATCEQVYGNLRHTIDLTASDGSQIESGQFLEFVYGGQSLLPTEIGVAAGSNTATVVPDDATITPSGITMTMTLPQGQIFLNGDWNLGSSRRKTHHDVLGGNGIFTNATGQLQMGGWRSWNDAGDASDVYLYFSGRICTP